MRVIRMFGLFAATLALALFPASAGQFPSEIEWSELAGLIVGHHVSISLAGGGSVQGEALSVRRDSLVLDVARSSDRVRYPRGQSSMPRSEVTEVRLITRRGAGGRILGSAVGALAGIVVGAEAAIHTTDSEAAGVSMFTAGAVACTVAGFLAGRALDRRMTVLHIAAAGNSH
ncbi:MAG: hypothetical protein U0Q18_29475 [Bryobacteraceae bacterium]